MGSLLVRSLLVVVYVKHPVGAEAAGGGAGGKLGSGCVDGRLGAAEALTYGEFGEPEALTGFAKEIAAYTDVYEEPNVSVGNAILEASPELSFVCVRFDFGDVARSGGLAVRAWDDLGLRVWEFRDGMEGCASGPSAVTTTRPSMP